MIGNQQPHTEATGRNEERNDNDGDKEERKPDDGVDNYT